MKLYKKIAGLMVAGVMATTGLTGALPSSATLTANAADDMTDDWIHAEGSKLYDMNGNQVWLTGVNWFGFNCTENFPHGLWSADCDELLSSVADHGINCIRFPVSTELLVSWMNGTPLEPVGLNASNDAPYYVFNPDFYDDENGDTVDSMLIFDTIMKKMKKYGIKAIVDVHSPASHNSGHNYNLWYYSAGAADADNMAVAADGTEMTTDHWIDSLVWLADKYKNDDTIIAYDLKNEPHGKRGYSGTTCPTDVAKWDGTTDENNWAYAATRCGKAILEVNPNALILIEGVEQYPKTENGATYDTADIWQATAEQSPWHGAWWGGNLRGVRDYPIDFGDDTLNKQIVYSPHDYGPSVYAQTWFDKDFTTQSLLDDYWYDTWAYINEEDIAPLLIGEWGGHMDADKNQKWMELLRDYMVDNHINHTFWCLNPNSGDTGGLLDSSFKVWDDEKYALFEESLWQTLETGKYIGLDHKTPLGTNGTGLSLDEFYGGISASEGSNINGGTVTDGSSGSQPTDPITSVKGDVTGDGKVTIADLVKVAKYIVQAQGATLDLDSADVNGDKKVNAADLILYRKYISGKIASF